MSFIKRDTNFYVNQSVAQGTIPTPATGWTTPANYTPTRTFDAAATTLNEVANTVATIIADEKALDHPILHA